MDGFTIVVVFFMIVAFAAFYAIGKYHPRSGAEVLDWKPTRSYEDEVRLELEDVDQMIEAQNIRRRASGRPEISEDSLRVQIDADTAEQRRRTQRED